MIDSIRQTLSEGGLTLWVLLLLAVAIYSILFGLRSHLVVTRKAVEQGKWKPSAPVSKSLPWQTEQPSVREIERSFAAHELDEMAWIGRRIPFLAVLIAAAPLLGLLGTVAGMLLTFSGLAAAGAQAPIDTISTGISKALVTTQAGLVIAIPAAFLLALLKRQAETTQLQLQQQFHRALAGKFRT